MPLNRLMSFCKVCICSLNANTSQCLLVPRHSPMGRPVCGAAVCPQPQSWGDSQTLRTAEGRWFRGAQPRASSSGHMPVPVLDPFLLKLAQVGVAFCTRP